MFRLTQQQVLKTRITGQVVNTARNSINHSIRFNSVAIERTQSQSKPQDPASLSFTNTIKNVANLQKSVNNNKKNDVKRGKGYHNNDHHIDASSPWFKQLCAFRDCLSHIIDLNDPSSQPFFWDTLKKAMVLYDDLKGTPDFHDSQVSLLIYALHTGLRANRNQLTRLAKKPDYDARSFHTDMNEFIKASLRQITNDLLSGVGSVNESGAMHLLTSLKELKLENEAIAVWSSSMEKENLKPVFLRPKVVGVLLPIMYQCGSKFNDLEELYHESKSLNTSHPHLISGMLKTCLAAGENRKALELFSELCSYNDKSTYSALVDVHLALIGDCKDITIANTFFEKAISRETPYRLTLHVNSVKQFIQNIWTETHDFEQVRQVWEKVTVFYGRNIHHGISSSLNNTFFDIFFENYADNQQVGLETLKSIIATYNDIKPIDEPFFNIIISKCVVWKDKVTIDSLYSAYELYNLKKTQVSRRIYLKSLGSVDATANEILDAWYDLLLFNDSERNTYIANADWAALRDATFASSEDRALLYAQILKQFQCFCRDQSQFKRLHSIVNLYPVLSPYLKDLSSVDARGIFVPQFQNLQRHNF
ncbi:RMD9 [Cyberlindnera jadinii]|uniref:RMD9 protein n=1 Tax=Cyberlindnera jadinii (strain ATCC 18201 / CBS 1600 / BCRC 20928 / JCM 3617 / NBRC 0987 / NRRL Y-1542) TaxID=983966 RepID=A0A0H5CCG5_CYBJN|nr:hypothetical protein CYBJADRAFT_176463 [Cyberlindnera jadinii NRRL Y-1542]ODV75113.1 hypothetical protein CYBJADRAFT_176463 [Cyberlindnera jadinii NRRL Y-1542]CEP22299.1 RMD9 [Cyberlindnera jadinii]